MSFGEEPKIIKHVSINPLCNQVITNQTTEKVIELKMPYLLIFFLETSEQIVRVILQFIICSALK